MLAIGVRVVCRRVRRGVLHVRPVSRTTVRGRRQPADAQPHGLRRCRPRAGAPSRSVRTSFLVDRRRGTDRGTDRRRAGVRLGFAAGLGVARRNLHRRSPRFLRLDRFRAQPGAVDRGHRSRVALAAGLSPAHAVHVAGVGLRADRVHRPHGDHVRPGRWRGHVVVAVCRLGAGLRNVSVYRLAGARRRGHPWCLCRWCFSARGSASSLPIPADCAGRTRGLGTGQDLVDRPHRLLPGGLGHAGVDPAAAARLFVVVSAVCFGPGRPAGDLVGRV